MPLGTFAPGEYDATYDGTDLGLCTTGGKNLRYRFHEQPINDTDGYGRMTIDTIYQGVDALLVATFKEWNAGVRKVLWPWSVPASPVVDGKVGTIAQLGSAVAKDLILTPKTGTPAATNGPTQVRMRLAKLAPENEISLIFGPLERDIPVVLQLLPYDVGSNVIHVFEMTHP